MQKKFLTNLALLLFLNLLVKPFWVLGIDRSVQNVVGAQDFGFYFSILNFSFLFYIILDLGITNFNNRNIAQHNQLLNKHLSGILILKVLLMVVYFFVLFSTGLIIGYSGKQLEILAWVGLNQFLLSLILYLRSNISGLLMFRTDSMLSVLDRLLMILFCSVLLWGNITDGEFRIEWFVYAQTAAYALTALIALMIVIRKSALRRLNWNRAFFLMILKKSFPFALLALLMSFYFRIDPVMIERLLPGTMGEQQSGVYAQAYRLLDAANMIAFLFAVLLLPIFSKMIAQGESIEELAKLSFSLLATVSVIVAVGSYLFSSEIMHLLYPRHGSETAAEFALRIRQSSTVFSILMFGFVMMSTSYIFSTLLTANGSLRALNIIAAIAVAISLTLNVLLIPRFLATGSALASITSLSVSSVAHVLVSAYVFRFRRNFRFLLALAVYVTAVILFGYFSRMLNVGWIYSLSLMVIFSFIAAFFLRLLNIRNFIQILRSSE